jgi:hypothetical protein
VDRGVGGVGIRTRGGVGRIPPSNSSFMRSRVIPEEAAAFIRFLIEPDSRAVWTACGFDPL